MTPRFLLFLIDGMRPDGMIAAHAPRIKALRATGASTLTACTVMPSITLPCHTSLFYGVNPDRHGITTNTWAPPARPTPSLIEALHWRKLPSASFYNWEQLRDMSPAGVLNVSVCLNNCGDPDGDARLCDVTIPLLLSEPWSFAFVYLGWTDMAGHREGWMTPTYLDAIAKADVCVGRIVDAVGPQTTFGVMADHGGHEKTHGTDSPDDMTIPLVFHGPGITPGTALRPDARITDVAPTILKILGVSQPDEWIGTSLL